VSAVPTWLGATTTASGVGGQANQFLGTHSATFIYGGTLAESQTTGSTVYSTTQSQYLAQAFTTSAAQTAIGSVLVQVSAVGGSPLTDLISPLQVALYPDVGGIPGAAAVAVCTVGEAYVYLSPFWVLVPLVASGLSPLTTYHLVASPAGSSAHYYVWQQSNQSAGAAVSPDGVNWTTEGFGLMFQVFDQSVTGRLNLIYEDAGARWTQLAYNATGGISAITEYTTAQLGGSVESSRALTYANGLVTGVS
jgi:hypothetical protein